MKFLKTARTTLSSPYVWPIAGAALAACASAASPDAMGTGASSQEPQGVAALGTRQTGPQAYTPAAVRALPDSRCQLHPEGSKDLSEAISVSTDPDGVARFHAVRATEGDAVKRLVLDCTDANGTSATYQVDLLSDATFAARPIDVARAPGLDRPALKGDPLSYTQMELLEAGYGLRPDPVQGPDAYEHWLEAASRPGRRLQARQHHVEATAAFRPLHSDPSISAMPQNLPVAHSTSTSADAFRLTPDNTIVQTTGWPWVGPVMTGAATYDSSWAQFTVPTATPGGYHMGSTGTAIWNGLGGLGGGGLIQGGIQIHTTRSSASYSSFREYCCGAGLDFYFTPSPGDTIYSQHWYCDANGSPNVNGGYGCSFLQDVSSGAVVMCDKSDDPTCPSYAARPGFVIGGSAEFVVETLWDSGHGFPKLTPFTMKGAAHSTTTRTWETVTSDPTVLSENDFTSAPSRVSFTLAGDQVTFNTQFDVSPFRDVNLDGEFDVIWNNPGSGETQAWFLNGTDRTGYNDIHEQSSGALLNTPPGWTVVGSADINYDGKVDLLLEGLAGNIQVWFLNGTDRIGSNAITEQRTGVELQLPFPWKLGAVNDLSGDRKPDVVIYNTNTGETQVWVMSGTTRVSYRFVTDQESNVIHAGPGWNLQTAGDIDLDGQADLVWVYAPTGETQVWFMNGTVRKGTNGVTDQATGATLYAPDPWVLKGSGLIDNGLLTDLIWSNTSTGETQVWFMSGTTRKSFNSLHEQSTGQLLLPPAPWVLTAE